MFNRNSRLNAVQSLEVGLSQTLLQQAKVFCSQEEGITLKRPLVHSLLYGLVLGTDIFGKEQERKVQLVVGPQTSAARQGLLSIVGDPHYRVLLLMSSAAVKHSEYSQTVL